jgi:hypothetical protein
MKFNFSKEFQEAVHADPYKIPCSYSTMRLNGRGSSSAALQENEAYDHG